MIHNFGEKVRQARGSLTQQQLADRLGVTIQHLQAVEYQKSLLSMDKLVQMCEVTGKAPSFFLQDCSGIREDEDAGMWDIVSSFSGEQMELLSVVLEAITKKNVRVDDI